MIAALLTAAASAAPLAWRWPEEGLIYRLEAELDFAEPVAMELGEDAPRVSALRLVTQTWCAPEDRELRCEIRGARLQMETSRAAYGPASDVLSRLQRAIEGSSVSLRVGERGELRRIRIAGCDEDRQTGALYEALIETSFWGLDLQAPADPEAERWTQRGLLLDLDADLEHRRDGPPEPPGQQGVRIGSEGRDRVVGHYLFDTDRGWVRSAELEVELDETGGGLISLSAAEVHPCTRRAAATWMKRGDDTAP